MAHLRFHLVVTCVLLVTFNLSQCMSLPHPNVGCDFLDSRNITDPVADSHYSGDNVNEFDYELINGTIRQPARPHRRACVCRDRPCVRLLCPRGMAYNSIAQRCEVDERLRDLILPVRGDDNEDRVVNIFEDFGYTVGRPACSEMLALVPETLSYKWHLDKSGNIVTKFKTYGQRKYYLHAGSKDASSEIKIVAYVCTNISRAIFMWWKELSYGYGSLVSVTFLFATLLVYAVLPELRNEPGKSLMCYMLSLIIFQTFVSNLFPFQLVEHFAYTSYTASLMWLSVINFDLWRTFRSVQHVHISKGQRNVMVFNSCVWGIALANELFYGLNSARGVPKWWIYCEYLKLWTFVIANATFFTLTTLNIRHTRKEIVRVSRGDSQRAHRENYAAPFLRLLIMMGVWRTMCLAIALMFPHTWLEYPDVLLHCTPGIEIFALFVMRPRVYKLLRKRWSIFRGDAADG